MDVKHAEREFTRDKVFSEHKDEILRPLWEQLSYTGDVLLMRSDNLQKNTGSDLIIAGDIDLIKIDTKHVRGEYDSLFLEEDSCPHRGTPGWLNKPPPNPDWLSWCFWLHCYGCFDDCRKSSCSEEDILPVRVYLLDYPALREWFLNHRYLYPLHHNCTLNRTTGRKVPVSDLSECIISEGVYPVERFRSLLKGGVH